MNANDICEVTFVDYDKVNKVRSTLPNIDILNTLSASFKILGDHTRLGILSVLKETELCVCDISAILEVSISSVSHHLRLLRSHKMVKFRKNGKMVYYSTDDDHIKRIIDEGLKHIKE